MPSIVVLRPWIYSTKLTDLLQKLRDAGIRCAVGSSGYKPNVDFVLEKCRIEPYFDARISGDMVSRCKPDPEIYLTAAAALGLPAAECVVFEDAPAGIEAARRAGAGHIVALATTLDRVPAGAHKIHAGILAIEYNQNPNRQITVNLRITG